MALRAPSPRGADYERPIPAGLCSAEERRPVVSARPTPSTAQVGSGQAVTQTGRGSAYSPLAGVPYRISVLWYAMVPVVFMVAWLPDVHDFLGPDATEIVSVAM